MSKEPKKNRKANDVSADDYLAAQAELNALKKEHGLAQEDKGINKLIGKFFDYRENRQKVSVSRKKLLWLAVLTGWFGGHRFYCRQYVTGALYLLFFWTGVPAAMTFIDLMIYIPIPPDENGNILI